MGLAFHFVASDEMGLASFVIQTVLRSLHICIVSWKKIFLCLIYLFQINKNMVESLNDDNHIYCTHYYYFRRYTQLARLMGPTWAHLGPLAPDEPYVGPMNLAIRDVFAISNAMWFIPSRKMLWTEQHELGDLVPETAVEQIICNRWIFCTGLNTLPPFRCETQNNQAGRACLCHSLYFCKLVFC